MIENVGPKEQKVRIVLGAVACAVAIFVPLRYKWKGLLAAGAFSGLFSGVTGYSPIKQAIGLGNQRRLSGASRS